MPLQKSFSEQSRFSKRPQWQRSKSHSAVNAPPKQPALAPVSETTKNKLQKFQFHRQPGLVATNKTEGTYGPNKGRHGRCAAGSLAAGHENVVPPETKDSSPNGLGQKAATTPIGRLAWRDLVGSVEKRIDEEEEGSPNERIQWNTANDSSSAITPMPPRRSNKRARSSSPVSSPAPSKPNAPAVDLKMLAEALKSPNADPALELWDKFSLNGVNESTPLGPANPMLAHLMVSSSPQPHRRGALLQHDSSLRRAVSCGGTWAKRRRVEKAGRDPPSTSNSESPLGKSKSSMVSALLRTVTTELEDPAIAQRMEAQESPSRKRNRPSPRKKMRNASAGPALGHAGSSSTPAGAAASPGSREKKTETLSDYGDDDFDDDTLMELDATLVQAPSHESHESPAALMPDPAPKDGHLDGIGVEDFDDEFGEMDDDILAEAGDLVANVCHTMSRVGTVSRAGEPRDDSGQHQDAHDSGDDMYGDDFGGDFDFEAAELAATQSIKPSNPSLSHSSQKTKAIQRYLVTKVLSGQFVDERGRDGPEKILIVEAERTCTIRTVHLRGDWLDTAVSPKSYVHIIGDFGHEGCCIIDNSQNILILHPDQLISATVVADSFSCTRRAVLQDRVKAASEPSPPLVYGTLLHEIFQGALMANKWDVDFLNATIESAMEKHVEELYTIKVSLGDAREHLQSKMTELRHWAGSFVASRPKPDAFVQGRNGEKANMCVSKLLDVEEHVWSPMYGLKGNIDATVQVTMSDKGKQRTLTVPLEVKTGRNATSNHQAQTVLYNLLLSDRYDIDVAYGILYYMETSQTMRIPAVPHELRHMIMQRNQLACYVRERSVQLPPMKKNQNACGKCYAQSSCFTYHKLADDGDGETSGMKDKFEDVVNHLTPRHKEFFLKWEDLLTKEEKESQKFRRELWTMVSSERERLGRAFGYVVIEDGSATEESSNPKINRYHYTFVKEHLPAGFSFLDSQLAVGEPIVVSDEQGHFALALGYVTTVKKQRISVAVDRRLHNARVRQPGFDEANNQVFTSIMEVASKGTASGESRDKAKGSPVRYRLDKDEFSNGMAIVRNNLVQTMADGPLQSREIRRLVVDLVPPRFKSVATQYTISDRASLNVDQKKAIEKVMSAQDYALVLGMPGTGKTTTIAHIIRALVCQGKTVLLTSYTHTAVDNILLKLEKDSIPILRIGATAKVHPQVREFVTLAAQPKSTFEEIKEAWHGTPVVATTCLGVSHQLFNERQFDYCIVDEASQITLPICLGPIRMARTFVLVGDHNQLPPLVQNEEARVGGLDVSLFKLLSDTHPDSVVNLEHQYRMCEDIMTLSNTLIYEGRLKCGTDELRSRKLHIPNMGALRRHHYDASTFLHSATASTPSQHSFCTGLSSCWLRELLEPDARVRFINTDMLPASREEAKGQRIVNPVEARIVVQLVEALLATGVAANEIGVMTHYRSQLSLLKHGLRGVAGSSIEMHTADRFQGRDKEVVVLSLVRSNEACSIGDLLKDWRRINVAFTRAKTKLLVVGSRDTLKGSGSEEMLARFIGLMEDRDWIYDLPAGALENHFFDDGATQITASTAMSTRASPIKASMTGVVNKVRMAASGKENQPPGPKRAKFGEKTMLKGKPILRDVLNDMMGGIY